MSFSAFRVGVELDVPLGNNSGRIRGHQYFKCQPGYSTPIYVACTGRLTRQQPNFAPQLYCFRTCPSQSMHYSRACPSPMHVLFPYVLAPRNICTFQISIVGLLLVPGCGVFCHPNKVELLDGSSGQHLRRAPKIQKYLAIEVEQQNFDFINKEQMCVCAFHSFGLEGAKGTKGRVCVRIGSITIADMASSPTCLSHVPLSSSSSPPPPPPSPPPPPPPPHPHPLPPTPPPPTPNP